MVASQISWHSGHGTRQLASCRCGRCFGGWVVGKHDRRAGRLGSQRTGPTLDVGRGMWGACWSAQAAGNSAHPLRVLGPPHLVSRPAHCSIQISAYFTYRNERTTLTCKGARPSFRIDPTSPPASLSPIQPARWHSRVKSYFQGCIILACCIHAAMTFLLRRT